MLLSAEFEPSLDCILSRGRDKWPFVVTLVSALLTTRLRPVALTIDVERKPRASAATGERKIDPVSQIKGDFS